MLSRRQLLGGLAGAGALGFAGSLVGYERLAGPPQPPHPVPSGPVGTTVQTSLRSAAMGRSVRVVLAYPERPVPGLPVLLQLHGRGNDPRDAFRVHHLDAYLSDAVQRGVPPFVVVAAEGGNHSYWHPRADGTDPQRMLLDELLPLLADRGLQVDRFGVGGWSMGGYGAILLAEAVPDRVSVLVPDSPAIFPRWKDTSRGSFDSRADFEEHDVLARATRLERVPTRVSCGTSDPFIGPVRTLLRQLPGAARLIAPGGHDRAWWMHAAPSQLAFAGRHLAAATMVR